MDLRGYGDVEEVSSMSSPLETRSLPGHPWERVPTFVKDIDENLRRKIIDLLSPEDLSWLKWLIEHPLPITIFFVLVLGLFAFIQKKKLPRGKAGISLFLFFLVSLGISDFLSYQLKILIGRLKPHVTYYNANPDFLPALSLPSNHAFNTSCLFFLLWLLPGKKNFLFFSLLAAAVLWIGLTRILLGQHYPLDIFSGWVGGFLLAQVLLLVWKRLSRPKHA